MIASGILMMKTIKSPTFIIREVNEQRGGFITPQEQMELQGHIQLRSEYEMISMKHFMSGGKDAGDIVNNFVRR